MIAPGMWISRHERTPGTLSVVGVSVWSLDSEIASPLQRLTEDDVLLALSSPVRHPWIGKQTYQEDVIYVLCDGGVGWIYARKVREVQK